MIWVHAHNGYLQLLAELGVIGSALVLVAFAYVARVAWLGLASISGRGTCAAVLGGIVGFSIFSIADVVIPGLSPLVVLAALMGSVFMSVHSTARIRSRASDIAIVTMLLVPLATLVASIPGQVVYEKAVSAGYAGEAEESAELLGRAVSLDSLVAYQRSESVALSVARSDADSPSLLALSVTEPFDASSLLNYLESVARQNRKESRDDVIQANSVIPHEEVASLELGVIANDVLLSDMADKRFEAVLVMNPWMVDSPYWSDVLDDADRFSYLVEQAVLNSPCAVASEFLLTGLRPELMSRPIRDQCTDDSAAALTLELLHGDAAKAVYRIEKLGDATPDDFIYRRLSGLAAYMQGDIDKTRRQWAIAAKLGDPWSALQLARTYKVTPSAVRAALIENYVGYSPVLRDRSLPVYRFGSSRFQAVYRRLHPATVLLNSRWASAATGLHLEILAELAVNPIENNENGP